MAKIHDLFIVELAEVIKGYGNDPDVEDPFRLSEFYRFYELPNIAISRENFENMRPIEERKKGKWIIRDNPGTGWYRVTCSECGEDVTSTAPCIGFFPNAKVIWDYCPNCGARMSE